MFESLNILGEPLNECSCDPSTGFYRDDKCNTGHEDSGMHTVCCEVDEIFLEFSKRQGNDLSTPHPEFGFQGLNPGDHWCLCAGRWLEAYEAGAAPKVNLAATHEETLAVIPLTYLQKYALKDTI